MTLNTSVSGNLYWGGMGGTLTLENTSDEPLTDWSVTFVTRQADVQVWSSNYEVVDLGDGLFEVTVTPPAWGAPIAAGESINLNFNANSVGLPTSGSLTDELFFAGETTSSVVETPVVEEVVAPTPEPVAPTPIEPVVDVVPEPTQGDLDVEVSITGGWGNVASGNVTVTNNTGATVAKGYSVTFNSDTNFTSISNFDFTSVQLDDGTYDITLSPKSWAGDLAAGASSSSYYQAEAGAAPAPTTPVAPVVTPVAEVIETVETVEPTETITPEPTQTPLDVVEGGTVLVDYESPDGGSDKRIVTYFEEWGIYSRDVNLSDVDGQSMTHMNYSFFDVKADGSVTLFDEYAATQKRFSAEDSVSRTFTAEEYASVDSALIDTYNNSGNYTITESGGNVTVQSLPVGWNDAGLNDAGNFEQLARFKELNPEVSLGFALGGWTLSDEFSTAYSTEAGQDQFVSDTIDILTEYDFFNVVDFDWEYPGGGGKDGNAASTEDGANFESVLSKLDAELDTLSAQTGQNYEISIATAGGYEKLENLNLEGIDQYVDFYNVMTYDFHGGWEGTTGHQAAMTGDANNYDVTGAVQVFEDAGVDLNKVVIGAPAYTRAWGGVEDGGTLGYQQSGQGADATGSFEAGVYDYKDLNQDVITGQTNLYWDDDNKAAFTYDGDEFSSIETPATIAGKAAYVEEKDLGGMMFWALSNDAPGEYSLVEAADDVLNQGVSYDEVANRGPEFDGVIGGDGAFSMTDFTNLAVI